MGPVVTCWSNVQSVLFCVWRGKKNSGSGVFVGSLNLLVGKLLEQKSNTVCYSLTFKSSSFCSGHSFINVLTSLMLLIFPLDMRQGNDASGLH